MEILQLQLNSKNRMVEEIIERCPPGFTGQIELFGDMIFKSADKYYVRATFKNGKPHNLEKEAIYVNHKELQEYHFVVDGVHIAYYLYDIYDQYPTGEINSDGSIAVEPNYIEDMRIRIPEKRFVQTRMVDGIEWIDYIKRDKILSVPNIKKMIVREEDEMEDFVFEIEHDNMSVN